MIAWSPTDKGSGVALSNSNLTAVVANTTVWHGIRAAEGKISGKWYWEITVNVAGYLAVGIATAAAPVEASNTDTEGAAVQTTTKYGVETGTWTWSTAVNVGDTIGVLMDLDNGTLGYTHNGASKGNAFTTVSTLGRPLYAAIWAYNASSTTVNFGASGFVGDLPAGYKAYDHRAFNYSAHNQLRLKRITSPARALLTNNNTTLGAGAAYVGAFAATGKTSGKWYWEVTVGVAGISFIGVAVAGAMAAGTWDAAPTGKATTCTINKDGAVYNGTATVFTQTAITFAAGNVIGVLMDATARTIQFTYNGTSMGAAFAISIAGTDALYPALWTYIGYTLSINLGYSAFTYSPPSDYLPFAQPDAVITVPAQVPVPSVIKNTDYTFNFTVDPPTYANRYSRTATAVASTLGTGTLLEMELDKSIFSKVTAISATITEA